MSELEVLLRLAQSVDETPAACMVIGLDAVLDEAYTKAHTLTHSEQDPVVGQVLALLDAANNLVDQLMDEMGLHDADDTDDKAAMTAGELTETLLKLAGDAPGNGLKPYGNVKYADPKNGKYPVDTAEHAKAAWAYINKPENAAKYPLNGVSLSAVKAKIRSACTRFGIELSD
jgi:hypothetical protein